MPAIHITVNNTSWTVDEFYSLCQEAFTRIVNETPVNTGACQDAWQFDFAEDSCEMWNDTEYVSYLEEGWSSQASSGFIESILYDVFASNFSVT
jgi:hypothetical protein